MYCEECNQKQATVHLSQVVNGKLVENHLCEDCAGKKGMFIVNLTKQFSIPNLLGSIFGSPVTVQDIQSPPQVESCPNCGIRFMDIRHTGKLGCSECYQVYEQELEPILRRIHGNSQHMGKIPSRSGEKVLLRKQIEELKQKLQESVACEKYEQAAEIRDSIKEMESQLQ